MESMSFCPECGHKVQGGARFCAKCGQQLDSVQASPEASPAVGNQLARKGTNWSSRSLLVVVFAVLVAGAGGYVGVQFWRGQIGHSSPSETVRDMVVAANDRQVGALQQQLSQWFRGEVERAAQQEGRPPEDLLAAEFTRSGSIQHIDILAERTCGQEASVYFRLRFSDGESRPSYAHLVTENGIWKINDLEDRTGHCGPLLDESEVFKGQPLHSWSVVGESAPTPSTDVPPGESTAPVSVRQLTRQTAASLVAASDGFAGRRVETVDIDAQDLQEGQSRGFWNTTRVVVNPGVPRTGWYDTWELTPDGKAYFSKMGSDLMQIRMGGVATGARLTLQQPVERTIASVTGIRGGAQGDQSAQVDFTWQIPAITTDTFAGEAALQLYDDGWRIQGVSLSPPGTVRLRFDTLPEDKGAREEARQAAERAAQQRAAEEAARLERLGTLLEEKQRLEQELQWSDTAGSVARMSIKIWTSRGPVIPATLSLFSAGLALESAEVSGRWEFWRIGSPDLLPWPRDDTFILRLPGQGEVRITDTKAGIKPLLQRVQQYQDAWRSSDQGQRQVAARDRLSRVESELASLRR